LLVQMSVRVPIAIGRGKKWKNLTEESTVSGFFCLSG